MTAETITALYAGIDDWGRATFRAPSGTYYCTIDKLFNDTPEQARIDGQSVYIKGRHFEGEPSHPVTGVELKVEA